MKNKNIDKTFLRDITYSSEKIDGTDSTNFNDKILDERETRKRLLNHARIVGCEKDMLLLFQEADKLMKNCTNAKEREDMGKLYSVRLYRMLGGGGELYINGQLVCKDD